MVGNVAAWQQWGWEADTDTAGGTFPPPSPLSATRAGVRPVRRGFGGGGRHDRAVTAARRTWVVPLGLAGAFAAVTALVTTGSLLGADAAMQPWLTGQADGGAGARVAGVLAALGEQVVAGFVLAGTVVWACARGRSVRPALAAATAVVGTALTVVVVKVSAGRTDPGAGAGDVLAGGRSYPSGHAATAAVCLLLVAFLVCGVLRGRARRAVVVAATALSVAVAWATVALGFHWVSDVVAGLLVGAGWATGVRPWLTADTLGGARRPGR
jgi:undecaprenyl-diphosphatase